MKKFSVLIGLMLLIGTMSLVGQNQRVLLFECFTNTSCGPCASQNPALDALITANQGKVVAVKYHMSWPGPNDPMYLHNTADNNARRGYYGVSYVPYTVVDGNRFADMPSGISQAMVNNWSSEPSPFDLQLSCQLNADQTAVHVDVLGRASEAVSGELKLHVAVIENTITYNSAPGSNGERVFHQVMKKMLPSSSGTTLSNVQEGSTFAYSFDWTLANVYDVNEITAIAWIQDNGTKSVHQACAASDDLHGYFTNDASVNAILYGKSRVCSGTMEPSFILSNSGNQALTSATIEVLVNDEVVKTMEWTGEIPFMGSEIVSLGEVDFAVKDNNVLVVRVVSVNGVDDENESNDSKSFSFQGTTLQSAKTLKLTIRTDNNPGETTWEVRRTSNGEVVASGGPYEEEGHMYNETIEVPGDDCYEFTIFDAGGDGLTDGSGIYGMKAGSTTLFSGSDFTDRESNEFNYELHLGADEMMAMEISIYPNPSNGIVSVAAEGRNSVEVFNAMGQRVYETAMENEVIMDLGHLSKGVYMIRVNGDNSVATRQLVISE